MIRGVVVLLLLCCIVRGQGPPTPAGREPEAGEPTPPADSSTAEPLHVVEPAYPIEAEKGKLYGLVVVKVLISEQGEVESTSTVRGDPPLADAAMAAVKEWKFKPFIKNGKPAKVFATLPFDFIFVDQTADSTLTSPRDSLSKQAMKIVWLSHGVRGMRPIKHVYPIYPEIAKVAGVQGNVVLFAFIGKDGQIRQINILSGHPLLTDAAVKAVKQWRYEPYHLDGEAIDVQTRITVVFSLSGS